MTAILLYKTASNGDWFAKLAYTVLRDGVRRNLNNMGNLFCTTNVLSVCQGAVHN